MALIELFRAMAEALLAILAILILNPVGWIVSIFLVLILFFV